MSYITYPMYQKTERKKTRRNCTYTGKMLTKIQNLVKVPCFNRMRPENDNC